MHRGVTTAKRCCLVLTVRLSWRGRWHAGTEWVCTYVSECVICLTFSDDAGAVMALTGQLSR